MATSKRTSGKTNEPAAATADDDPYVKTTIFVRGSNWRALRTLGVNENASASSIVAALVEQFLALDADERAPIIEAARRIRAK